MTGHEAIEVALEAIAALHYEGMASPDMYEADEALKEMVRENAVIINMDLDFNAIARERWERERRR